MPDDALKTLFHPFETGTLALPSGAERVLFLGAEAGFRPPAGFDARISAVQGFRPHFLALRNAGIEVAPEAEGEGYDAALILCGRHRGQNELWFSEAVRRTRPGATIVLAGTKKDGADSLRKRIAARFPLGGHLAKYHGVVFWLQRPSSAGSLLPRQDKHHLVEGRFHTAPGMFSHDRVDIGSRLLVGHLPSDLKGSAADFGAGWGYLSVELANTRPGIRSVDLYEADFASLQAARRNMAALAPGLETKFFWRDLLTESAEGRYDVIVMNPPFHQSRAADPSIGQGMIRSAASALKPGGRLFLVANRQMPYEGILASNFAVSGELAAASGFKVLWARR